MNAKLLLIPQAGELDAPAGTTLSESARAMIDVAREYYVRTGFTPPWASYLAFADSCWVGTCAFKSAPVGNRVELAYHTFAEFEGRGYATEMVRELVKIAKQIEPKLILAAQTLPADSASTSVPRKTGFVYAEKTYHPEDGVVWEWRHAAG